MLDNLDKIKQFHIKPPEPRINPDQKRQSEQGNQTSGSIGGWTISGSKLKSGGITIDAANARIIINDGTTDRILIGDDGT